MTLQQMLSQIRDNLKMFNMETDSLDLLEAHLAKTQDALFKAADKQGRDEFQIEQLETALLAERVKNVELSAAINENYQKHPLREQWETAQAKIAQANDHLIDWIAKVKLKDERIKELEAENARLKEFAAARDEIIVSIKSENQSLQDEKDKLEKGIKIFNQALSDQETQFEEMLAKALNAKGLDNSGCYDFADLLSLMKNGFEQKQEELALKERQLEKCRDILGNCHQIMSGWIADESWSDFDQQVLDSIIEITSELDSLGGEPQFDSMNGYRGR